MARLSDCSPDRRLTDLEVEDDGPDEAQRQLGIAVHDVLGPDVDQLDLQQGQSGPRQRDAAMSHCTAGIVSEWDG